MHIHRVAKITAVRKDSGSAWLELVVERSSDEEALTFALFSDEIGSVPQIAFTNGTTFTAQSETQIDR
jgi:hypothetical protein